MPNYFDHEPESVFQASFYKPEYSNFETPDTGDPVMFSTMNVTPTFNQNKNPLEVQGATLPVGMIQGLGSTEWSASGQLCLEELGFLSGIKPTGTVASGSLTGGVYATYKDTTYPNSFTFYHKGFKANKCVVSGFKIEGNTEEITTEVNFIGGDVASDSTTLTVAPSKPNLFIPYKTSIAIDNDAFTKVNSFTLDVSDIWSPVNYLGASNIPKQTVAQSRVSGKFSCVLPYDDGTRALNLLTDTDTHTVTITNITKIGDYNHTVSWTFDIMYDNAEAPSDTDNVWTMPLNGVIVAVNEASAKSIEFTYSKASANPGS